MKILVSNDDGIFAEGITVLAKSLSAFAEVVTVAPDRNRSGASTSLTLDRPLRVRELKNNRYVVEGTPTDCVHLGTSGLLSYTPDMVITGINEGGNLGDDVWYSGTVAGAMEGRFMGFPAIAVSLAGKEWPVKRYDTAAEAVKILMAHLIHDPLPGNTILNVNVPDVPFSEIRGFEITRLGTRHRAQNLIEARDPRGSKVYWIGLPGELSDASQGTDFDAINHNCVSITPLQIDLTHYKSFDQLSSWIKRIEFEHLK